MVRHPSNLTHRALLVLALLLTTIGWSAPRTSATQDATDATRRPSDLPAMALTVADLKAAGMAGYRVRTGERVSREALAGRIAGETALDERDAIAAVDAAGIRQSYAITLDLLEQPEDFASAPEGRVVVSLSEAEDSDGAGALFDLWKSDDEAGDIDGVAGAKGLGDESRWTRFTGVDDELDRTIAVLDVAFRLDRVHAYIRVMAFDASGRGPDEPGQVAVEALAERSLERIGSVLRGDAPELSLFAIRLQADGGAPVIPVTEYYEVSEGRAQPFVGMIDDSVEALSAEIERFRIESRYRLEYIVQSASTDPNAAGNPFVVVRIAQFADDRGAAEWVDGAGDLLDGLTYFSDVSEIEDAGPLGDSSAAVRYTVEYEDGTTVDGAAVFVQFGDIAFGFEVDNGDLSVATELAEAQVACLDEGRCPEAVSVPEALRESGD